jgi:hypothetical protein
VSIGTRLYCRGAIVRFCVLYKSYPAALSVARVGMCACLDSSLMKVVVSTFESSIGRSVGLGVILTWCSATVSILLGAGSYQLR